MKAVFNYKYGTPDSLQVKDTVKPKPRPTEILVKIYATSINASDWEFLTGNPFHARLIGLFKPRVNILGSDVAGVVEAAGSEVTDFKSGDEVFGDIFTHWGGFAEYVCAPESKFMLKPISMSFEQLAALPQAGVVALQGLRDKGKVKAGEKVLINGGGGGVGTFAIQLAKYFGAEVTAVDNAEKQEMMRALGADHVIDYKVEDFLRNGVAYDIILDVVAYRSVFMHQRALAANGRYVIVGGSMRRVLQTLAVGPFIKLITGKRMGILAHQQNATDLRLMIELFESGKVRPIIDRRFPLSDIPAAMRYLGAGHCKGKVIIKMEGCD